MLCMQSFWFLERSSTVGAYCMTCCRESLCENMIAQGGTLITQACHTFVSHMAGPATDRPVLATVAGVKRLTVTFPG
jgi:hypothetical protein